MSAKHIDGAEASRCSDFAGLDASSLLDHQAARFGSKALLSWEPATGSSETLSYADFAIQSKAYATGLAQRGVSAGDAVIIHMDNHPALLLVWFACARLGAIAVTTNTRSTRDELAYFVSHSKARFVVTDRVHAALALQAAPAAEWVACLDGASDCLTLQDLQGDPAQCPARTPAPDLPCNVIYTSGTTSKPKGVVWTHANVLWGARVNASHLRLTPDDCVMIFLPFFHAVALSWNFLATLASGGRAVLLPKFSASRFWPLALKHGCTWANMVGFTLNAVADQPAPERHDFRHWVYAAGDVKSVRDRWGIRTIGAFGMTELVCHVLCASLDTQGEEGAMGRPTAEYEAALRRDDGAPAAIGEIGHLWIRGVRGLSLFDSYLHDRAATEATFDEDGWFATGDLARMNENGEFFYAGRSKDMLRVGGENVAAIEIEAVVMQTPGVIEAAVVGQPDRMLDEVPVAFIVAKEPSEALRAAVLENCGGALANFKRPRFVHFVDALPRGLLDKVLKWRLREMAAELAGSDGAS